MIVLLDTGVLGFLTNPNATAKAEKSLDWMYRLLVKGVRICTSDVCDYEVRRSLVQARMNDKCGDGIERLDQLRDVIEFFPVTSTVFNEACYYWARANIKSQLNAPQRDINFDLILCGHWKILKDEFPGQYVVIATDNVRDFSRFVETALWQDIFS